METTALRPTPSPQPTRPDHPSSASALEVRGLEKSFAERRGPAGIDFEVGSGELVAILGANGSGKSTALRCVIGLEEPDGGVIRLVGRETMSARTAERIAARREAAMIFQQIHLVRRLDALTNVCCGAL